MKKELNSVINRWTRLIKCAEYSYNNRKYNCDIFYKNNAEFGLCRWLRSLGDRALEYSVITQLMKQKCMKYKRNGSNYVCIVPNDIILPFRLGTGWARKKYSEREIFRRAIVSMYCRLFILLSAADEIIENKKKHVSVLEMMKNN